MNIQAISDIKNINLSEYINESNNVYEYLKSANQISKYIKQIEQIRSVVIIPRHIDSDIDDLLNNLFLEHPEMFEYIESKDDWSILEFIEYIRIYEPTEYEFFNLMICSEEIKDCVVKILLGTKVYL